MKQVILTVFLLAGFNFLFAQPVNTWESLTKSKIKSDKAIEHSKKSKKLKTWVNRASLYFDIYSFNSAGLYKGLPAKKGFMCAEKLIGNPEKVLTQGNKETWIYKRKKLFFVNGTLDKWEETEFIDKDAITKSADAFFKAEEIDTEGKFKNKKEVKENAKNVRGAIINEGITKYEKKDYKSAYNLMNKGISLGKYPRPANDTAFKLPAVHYYAGIIASKGKMYKKSEKHFNECIKAGYEKGISYHYVADGYAQQGDSIKYINKVKEGFENCPNSEQLIIDLINYYISKNQPDKVIEYIDVAINKNPENPSYYSAKATIYDNRADESFDKYKKYSKEISENKKAAFRVRFEADKKAEFEKKMNNAQRKADKQKMHLDNAFEQADKLYKTSLAKDPKFFNAAFNLGRLYYKKHEDEMWISDWLFKTYKMKKVKESDKYKAKSKKSLNRSVDFFEKAHKANPNDRTTIDLLRSIYYKLRNKEKEAIYKKKLEQLGQANPGMK